MTPHEALKLCRDALADIALDLAIAEQDHIAVVYHGYKPVRHAAAAKDVADIRAAIAAADAALSAAPTPAETVTLVGVKNGVETVLGEVPMPPKMKARELVREMFGAWEPDDGSDPDLAMAVCEQLIDWMGKQASASLAAPAPAQAVPLTAETMKCGEQGNAP